MMSAWGYSEQRHLWDMSLIRGKEGKGKEEREEEKKQI